MTVDYEKEGRIAIFTINRPEALNAISMQVARELRDAILDFRDDPEIWVGIVTGAGEKAFSAGADIKDTLSFMKEHRHDQWVFPDSIWRGLELWKPLIAAVNGVALGGGLELTLSCDLIIASEKARFGTPEVTLGLIPGFGGTQRAIRKLPWCKAAELLLMGTIIDAEEAYRVGMVNKVVPPEQVMPTAKEWASIICSAAPLAVRAAKEAMLRGSSLSLEDGLRLENALVAYVMGTEDFTEGTKAFVEKRKPVYKGR
jgi:enoyl-CoA hydratase/carnithine racemase